jgi:hypothetical protein
MILGVSCALSAAEVHWRGFLIATQIAASSTPSSAHMPENGCAFSFKTGATSNPSMLLEPRKTFPRALPSLICPRRIVEN